MASSEQLSQLAFDFNRSSEEPTVSYTMTPGSLAELDHREPGVGRFVRAVKEGSVIRSPTEAARYLIDRIYTPFDAFDQEELWVLLLNTRGRLTHEALVYRGTLDTIHVRPAELFKAAVQVNASALLLSHYHPSGDPEPSPEDRLVTESACQAAGILGLDLLDHIVVGRDVWVSLKARGLGFD